MNITETSINSDQFAAGNGDAGGYAEVSNAALTGYIEAQADQVKLTAETVGASPVGVPLEIAASALKLTGLATVASPTGSPDPNWVKVTINGVAGVIPFYPQP